MCHRVGSFVNGTDAKLDDRQQLRDTGEYAGRTKFAHASQSHSSLARSRIIYHTAGDRVLLAC